MIKYSEELKLELIDLYRNQKVPISVIVGMKKFPGNRDTIRKYLRSWGIEANVKSLVTDFDKDILQPWLSGTSIYELSKKFHTNKSTISKKLKELGYEVINTHTEVKFDDTIFDSIDTEEKAYWLGFIYADGNIKTTCKTSYQLNITLGEIDYNHLVKFNIFSKHNTLNIKLRKKEPRNEYTWNACSKHLWTTLNNYGCTPNKSLTLEFPKKEIFKDESLIRHFIRGYFDGDGCISYDRQKEGIVPRCSMLGTENFIYRAACESNLPDALIQIRHSVNDYFNLKLKRIESINFMNWLYSDSTIYLDRKFKRYTLFKNNNFCIPYTSSDIEEFLY